ncbi:MAG: glucose-6-phosphate dehydrogenase assembly protein OpcA, partial [Spirochaetaceae bacterium]|nr:glucose-6-phosphate dehydrogenase assembly protein OpcA [Spirochaetaceae bacterium]
MTPVFQGSLTLRQRNGWEAADSGLLLWRKSFFYFIPLFVLPFSLFAFGAARLPVSSWLWSYGILWWFKPLFDRLILGVISVRFFEPGARLKRLLRGAGRTLGRGLAGDLLWRRLSPWRAARMPVRLLEGLRGKKARERIRDLEGRGLNFCVLLTLFSLILEYLLLAGECIFCLMTLELFGPELFSSFIEHAAGLKGLVFFAYSLNYLLVESLYVCMGFGLYVNSRMEREGWDLQLLFQGLVPR